ncbi:MAG: lipopolysaccharide kinase InaA family protein [Kiritimatiellia bacterium]
MIMTAGWTRRLNSHGLTWRVQESEACSLREWLDRYFPVRPDSDVRFLQAAPNRFVAAAGGLVLKEWGPRPGRSRFTFGLRPSAARLIVRRARALLACGIATHEPVAWAVLRVRGLRVRDYVITREITQAEVLTHRLDRLRDDPAGRRETLGVLGGLVANLHRNRFANRDLKDANILCSVSDPLRMWVTDLEGLRRFPWLPGSVAAGDLAPVALSLRSHGWLRDAGDAEAFFAAYRAGVPRRLGSAVFPAGAAS